MRILRNILIIVALLVAVGWAIVRSPMFTPREITWHQRRTITVATPDGPVSASSVTAVTAQDGSELMLRLNEAGPFQSDYSGEAVALEVMPGRWLFALLDGAGGTWAWSAFDLGRGDGLAESFRLLKEVPLDTPVPLPQEAWPRFVTFLDIDDPSSVREVDPSDLASSFGEVVQPTEVTLAITDAPVTSGRVEDVLDWWPNLRSGPNNELSNLRLPTESPRGWNHLSPIEFWSLDQLLRISGVAR